MSEDTSCKGMPALLMQAEFCPLQEAFFTSTLTCRIKMVDNFLYMELGIHIGASEGFKNRMIDLKEQKLRKILGPDGYDNTINLLKNCRQLMKEDLQEKFGLTEKEMEHWGPMLNVPLSGAV